MNPIIISSIILSIAFIIILLINFKIKNNIIKYSFIIYLFIYLFLILLYDNSFVYQFLRILITYIWYPSYLLFVITIIFNIGITIYTLFNNNLNKVSKIINYINFVISFSCYIIFLELKIDPSLYEEYYQLNSLVLVRITTISFLVGLIVNIIVKIRNRNYIEII